MRNVRPVFLDVGRGMGAWSLPEMREATVAVTPRREFSYVWQMDCTFRDHLRRHVAEELADPDAVFVLDPSAFPKKGTESCGVARQWCGRLGKVDNCQVGVFLAIAAKPAQPIEKGLPGPGMLAHTVLAEYGDHMPLYRQEDELAR